jgi:hypothetical protein
MTDEQMKYPIGKFKAPVSYTTEDLRKWTTTIKEFPGRLRQAIINLNEKQLDTQYRTGGWSLRQVVHHVADSHMNCLMRFKWALTEDNPTIKLLEGLHLHWIALLESFTEDQWTRTFLHPASGETMQLKKALALYAWHCKHHLAHVTETTKKL